MLEPGGHADLAQEALGAERGGELGVEHLERDRAVVLEVVREIDRGHAAAAELALEHVAVTESRRSPAPDSLVRAPLPHQALKARVPTQQGERRIEPEPGRGEPARFPHQLLEGAHRPVDITQLHRRSGIPPEIDVPPHRVGVGLRGGPRSVGAPRRPTPRVRRPSRAPTSAGSPPTCHPPGAPPDAPPGGARRCRRRLGPWRPAPGSGPPGRS